MYQPIFLRHLSQKRTPATSTLNINLRSIYAMSQNKRTIHFFADPGHGWARVPRAELLRLGILSAISTYSYQRGQYVYLEEDLDLSTYLQALKALHGPELVIKFNECVCRERYSRIRNYAHFRP
jgi:hypothetical protein